MLTLYATSRFRKDYKRMKKRRLDMTLLEEVIQRLLEEKPLLPKHRDHPLIGDYAGFRECHIQPEAMKIGLIVNPIAGMGGRVGLKGTDGDAVRLARERGAVPLSAERAAECLRAIAADKSAFALYTGSGEMGERSAREAGFAPIVVQDTGQIGESTSAEDTVRIARAMVGQDVSLILFAGGDGTARDICRAIGEDLLALGIPAGVKIHSAVFASSPRQAGELVSDFIRDGRARASVVTAEVMDIDEEAYRSGRLQARLYGYLRIPCERSRVQGLKSGTPASDAAAQEEVADGAAELLESEPETLFFIGAGSTTRALLDALGVKGTLLGVDAWQAGSLVGTDLAERDILALIERHKQEGQAKIVVTPIGGQGFVFGRGNQQFSPEVIRRVGRENIVLIASPSKLQALGGAPLLADTGDAELDCELEGYYRIVSGYGQYTMHKLKRG